MATHAQSLNGSRLSFLSKPNMSQTFAMCGGSGAVTSSQWPFGWRMRRLRAWSIRRFGISPWLARRLAAVFAVADDRRADRGHVRAQLVGAAGQRHQRDPRHRRRVIHRLEQRHRGFGVFVFVLVGDAHALAAVGGRALDQARRRSCRRAAAARRWSAPSRSCACRARGRRRRATRRRARWRRRP